MAWPMLIAAGVSLASSMLQGQQQQSAAKAQRKLDKANTAAANAVRGAGNKLAAAQSSLSNLMRSLGNQGKLRAGGEAVNALNTNLVRLLDHATTGSLNQQIAAAEQLGALRAATAANGTGGTAAAMLHQTMQLAHARATTTQGQHQQYQTHDMLMQRAGLQSNMALSVDVGQSFADIDHGIQLAPYRAMPDNGFMSWLSGGGGQMMMQGIGGMFGGAGGTGAGLFSAASAAPAAKTFPIQSGNSHGYLLS